MGTMKRKNPVSKNKALKTSQHLLGENTQLRDNMVKLISENRKLNKYVQTQWCVCGRAASLHIGQDLTAAEPPCTGFMAIREKTFQAYKLGLAVTLKLDPDSLTEQQVQDFRGYFEQGMAAPEAAQAYEAKLAGVEAPSNAVPFPLQVPTGVQP